MSGYLVRRFLATVPVVFGVTVLVFLVMHLAPGDPAQLMLGQNATSESIERLRLELELDRSLPEQYLAWLGRLVRGDLGRSLSLGRPVLPELLDRFGATALLATVSLVISTVAGLGLGVMAALRPGSFLDRATTGLALLGASTPVFWLGTVLIILFAQLLRWLPPGGMTLPGDPVSPEVVARHLLLPSLTLAAPAAALVTRLTRSAMIDVLRQDYVAVARAKGLAEAAVVRSHALRNAVGPVLTVVGIQAGYLLGGSIIVEVVFSWPGLGSLALRAISSRDYPVVQGITLLVATVFVLINLVVDLAYAWLNPRIRFA